MIRYILSVKEHYNQLILLQSATRQLKKSRSTSSFVALGKVLVIFDPCAPDYFPLLTRLRILAFLILSVSLQQMVENFFCDFAIFIFLSRFKLKFMQFETGLHRSCKMAQNLISALHYIFVFVSSPQLKFPSFIGKILRLHNNWKVIFVFVSSPQLKFPSFIGNMLRLHNNWKVCF